MPPSKSNETLVIKVSALQTLLALFTQTLTSPTPSTGSQRPPKDAPDPLHVLRDAAKVIHAHATKIGLLVINEPFTASAVLAELTRCEGEALVGMMGAVELCDPRVRTATMVKEVRLRVEAVMSAFGTLLGDVRTKAEGGSVTITERQRERTLASTGLVWEACEELVQLGEMGVAGLVVKKAGEYRELLRDAMEELKEWGEDEEDLDEGFVGSDDEDAEDDGDALENMFAGARLPAHRKDVKELLEETSKRLKLVDMLFLALQKRRAKTLEMADGVEDSAARADGLVSGLRSISEGVDELANAFYDLDVEQAQARLDHVLKTALDLANEMATSWTGRDDEFTIWLRKWKDALSKPTSNPKIPKT